MDISDRIWDEILEGMTRVVTEPGGSERWAAHSRLMIAGKTGTVQVGAPPDYETDAWFLALAPAAEPRIVLAVILEGAGSGPQDAAPLAGEFITRYWYLSVGNKNR